MLQIRNVKVGGRNPCFIIAEIGQNHQGDIEIAKQLILAAKECGVSCVKFQKSSLPHRFTKSALIAPYDGENSFGKTYGEHRAHLEFSEDEFKILQKFAEETVGIMFSASCMDIPSATFLKSIGVPFIKIGSGDTNNPLLIDHVAKLEMPVIISTGMSNWATVKAAYQGIKKYHSNFAMLHCVSAYPTQPEDVNLSVLQLYKYEFPDIPIGYSGHEEGIAVSIAAVACGAKIIEKHFTLQKTMKGTDHRSSLDLIQMKNLVDSIRVVESALGSPVKNFLPSEMACSTKLGKTLVALTAVPEGSSITLSNIAVKVSKPPGLPPQYITQITGCTALQSIDEDTPLTKNNVQLKNLLTDQ